MKNYFIAHLLQYCTLDQRHHAHPHHQLLYTAIAVCLYNCPEPIVQLYRQGKVAAIDEEGLERALASVRIIISSLHWTHC